MRLIERFEDFNFCIGVANAVSPQVQKEFKADIIQGRAWFKKCAVTEVIRIPKTANDRFDLAYQIACTYEQKFLQDTNTRWFECNDQCNKYFFPVLKVVVRDKVMLDTESVLKGMLTIFKANVLVLNHLAGTRNEARAMFLEKKIHLVFRDEVQTNEYCPDTMLERD